MKDKKRGDSAGRLVRQGVFESCKRGHEFGIPAGSCALICVSHSSLHQEVGIPVALPTVCTLGNRARHSPSLPIVSAHIRLPESNPHAGAKNAYQPVCTGQRFSKGTLKKTPEPVLWHIPGVNGELLSRFRKVTERLPRAWPTMV